MTDAAVYFDRTSNPRNPGWVVELSNETADQFQLDSSDPMASDDVLLAEARSFADGEIRVRR